MAEPHQSTDKTYASGHRSALQHSAADSRGRPGDPVRANPSQNLSSANRSTDKYYANAQGQGPTVQGSTTLPVEHPQSTAAIRLTSESEVVVQRDAIIERLKAGNPRVVIEIEAKDVVSLERLMRTQLELAVARGRITRDQFLRILYSRVTEDLPAEAVAEGTPYVTEAPPDPDLVPVAEVEDDLAVGVDMEAFVKGADAAPATGLEGTPVVETESDEDEDAEAVAALDRSAAAPEEEDVDDPDEDEDVDDPDEDEDVDDPEEEAPATETDAPVTEPAAKPEPGLEGTPVAPAAETESDDEPESDDEDTDDEPESDDEDEDTDDEPDANDDTGETDYFADDDDDDEE